MLVNVPGNINAYEPYIGLPVRLPSMRIVGWLIDVDIQNGVFDDQVTLELDTGNRISAGRIIRTLPENMGLIVGSL